MGPVPNEAVSNSLLPVLEIGGGLHAQGPEERATNDRKEECAGHKSPRRGLDLLTFVDQMFESLAQVGHKQTWTGKERPP